MPGWEAESRAEMRWCSVAQCMEGEEARVVKLSVGVLKLNHTYFKANSGEALFSYLGLLMSHWTGSIYLLENSEEKNPCGAHSVGRSRW